MSLDSVLYRFGKSQAKLLHQQHGVTWKQFIGEAQRSDGAPMEDVAESWNRMHSSFKQGAYDYYHSMKGVAVLQTNWPLLVAVILTIASVIIRLYVMRLRRKGF